MAQRTALLARPATARRADAGTIRLGDRDVAGLVLCAYLGVRADRVRGIVARWRHAGYAATGGLGAGPARCWLTRAGLGVTGQPYTPARPAAARLVQLRAVVAVRLSLELVYNKDDHQVSIYATITPSTPDTLAAIIARSEPPTAPAITAGLALSPQHPRRAANSHPR